MAGQPRWTWYRNSFWCWSSFGSNVNRLERWQHDPLHGYVRSSKADQNACGRTDGALNIRSNAYVLCADSSKKSQILSETLVDLYAISIDSKLAPCNSKCRLCVIISKSIRSLAVVISRPCFCRAAAAVVHRRACWSPTLAQISPPADIRIG